MFYNMYSVFCTTSDPDCGMASWQRKSGRGSLTSLSSVVVVVDSISILPLAAHARVLVKWLTLSECCPSIAPLIVLPRCSAAQTVVRAIFLAVYNGHTGLSKRNGAKFRELSQSFAKLADWAVHGR